MEESELLVQTNYGPVLGRHRVGLNGVQFVSFQGIRYARPPVGPLRFKDPQRPEPWKNVFDATSEGPSCPIPSSSHGEMESVSCSEDCLRLNVFKNNTDFTTKLPVMVFIHGGGFVWGSGNELLNNPDVLMRRDVVMVSFNYRLGVLGFLSIADPLYEIPGNAGLKDQTMALRWVVENIQHFGGDPANITIFGISAGGASVHYHLISSLSKGLFHKAIVQSGSALNPWANRSNQSDLNERLATSLGWNGDGDQKAMWDLILSTSTEELLKHQGTPTQLESQIGLIYNFVPTVEPYDNGNCFVPNSLVEMNRSAWGNQLPVIIGGTSDEGYTRFTKYENNKFMFKDYGYFDNALPKELDVPFDSEIRKILGNKLKRHYYADQVPSLDNLNYYASLLNEKHFWHGINAIVKARVANENSAPTYLYRFNYSSKLFPFMHILMAGRFIPGKAVHGDDMVYLLNPTNCLASLETDCSEWKMVELMLSLWTSFATHGKPESHFMEEWNPVQPSTPYKCLNIGKESKMIDLPNAAHIAFWDSLYDL